MLSPVAKSDNKTQANPKGKTKEVPKELGISGLNVYGGRVYEDPLTELSGDRWKRVLKDMLVNDPIVGALKQTVEMIARQTEWKIKPFDENVPEDVENADFIRNALFEDMSQTWQETLSEMLTFIWWGWVYLEKCYKRRAGRSKDKSRNSKFNDGLIGWRKFAIRAQESLSEWEFDEYNEVSAMVQRAETDHQDRTIPIEYALHLRTSSNKNNPEGYAILRAIYRPWYFKTNIENIRAIGIERNLNGYPVAHVPPKILAKDAGPGDVQLRNYIIELVQSIKIDESQGALFPLEYDDGNNPLYKLELLAVTGKNPIDVDKTIIYYDERMLMVALAEFILLGMTQAGNFALAESKTKTFMTALAAYLQTICDAFNRDAIPDLMEINGKPTDRSPYLAFGKIAEITLEQFAAFVESIARAGCTFTDEQMNFIKSKGEIPVEDN